MKVFQRMQKKIDVKQVETSIKINDNKPVAIALTSDWHIGSVGVDYERLESDLEIIRDTPGMYAVGLGDYKDNYIRNSPPGGEFGQILQPSMQDAVVFYFMSIISGKLLALVIIVPLT